MIGSLSFTEITFILILALLIFGPKRLPEMGRMIGRGMSEFRRASSELKRTFNAELSLDDDEARPALARRTPKVTVQTRSVARDAAPPAEPVVEPAGEPAPPKLAPQEPAALEPAPAEPLEAGSRAVGD